MFVPIDSNMLNFLFQKGLDWSFKVFEYDRLWRKIHYIFKSDKKIHLNVSKQLLHIDSRIRVRI